MFLQTVCACEVCAYKVEKQEEREKNERKKMAKEEEKNKRKKKEIKEENSVEKTLHKINCLDLRLALRPQTQSH